MSETTGSDASTAVRTDQSAEAAAGRAADAGVALMFLGGVILFSPVLVTGRGLEMAHNLAVGAIVGVLGAGYAAWIDTGRRSLPVVPAVVTVLGAWTAVAPVVLGFTNANLFLATIPLGVLTALVGAWCTYASLQARA